MADGRVERLVVEAVVVDSGSVPRPVARALSVTMGGPDAPTASEGFKLAEANATIEIEPVYRPAPGEMTCQCRT